MRNISSNFRREYIAGNRNYVVTINMTLANGTELTLTNENIWEGGFSFEEGVSSTDSFDVGSAIIGKCSIVIDNIKENFSEYDFYNATLWAYVGLEGLEETPIRIGYYTVDETSYNGSLITLTCLDNMWRFDTPFSDISITYPCTIREIINAMCRYSGIGITLATQSFHNNSFMINQAPEGELNCREVLQYLAQICCCYCKITPEGNLALHWYDKTAMDDLIDYDGGTFSTTTTPYSDGCELDGGDYLPVEPDKHFVPYDSGDEGEGGTFGDLLAIAYISQNSSMQVGTDDIHITGCRFCTSDPSAEGGYDVVYSDQSIEREYDRYILVFQDNPFVTSDTAQTICADVGNILAGLTLRTFSSSSLSDISIESGDLTAIVDFRGNRYYSWVTNTKFQTGNYEQFSCGAQSILENKTIRYSDTIKTLVEAKRNTQEIVSEYDQQVKKINDLANNAISFNEYVYPETGDSQIMWRYSGAKSDIDKTDPANPKFGNSVKTIFKITGDGTFVSMDGNRDEKGYPLYTNGYDANTGTALLSLIYTIGLNAEWIKAGTIEADRIKGSVIQSINDSTGTTTINGGKIATNSITASHIQSNAVTSDKISANAVTAGKISVDSLSSISANIGSITTGTISANCVSGGTLRGQAIVSNSKGIKVLGDGYVAHRQYENDSNAMWQFDLGSHSCNCMYSTGYGWAWVNGGAQYIYKYLEGAYSISDKRKKENIENLDKELSMQLILSVEPCKFNYIYDASKKEQFGMLAQDVWEIAKELGIEENNGLVFVPRNDEVEDWSIEYKQFVPHLINVAQSQQKEIDELKTEVAELKDLVNKLIAKGE